jgi:hypothetical protein
MLNLTTVQITDWNMIHDPVPGKKLDLLDLVFFLITFADIYDWLTIRIGCLTRNI